MSEYYVVDFGCNWGNSKKYPAKTVLDMLNTAWRGGVESVVSISNNRNETTANKDLAKMKPLYYTAGIHPHNAKLYKEGDMAYFETCLKDPKCFGMGECGLDYNRMFSPKEDRIQIVFALQGCIS